MPNILRYCANTNPSHNHSFQCSCSELYLRYLGKDSQLISFLDGVRLHRPSSDGLLRIQCQRRECSFSVLRFILLGTLRSSDGEKIFPLRPKTLYWHWPLTCIFCLLMEEAIENFTDTACEKNLMLKNYYIIRFHQLVPSLSVFFEYRVSSIQNRASSID